MKQKDKELLLKDLCARLPYGVKVKIKNKDNEERIVDLTYGNIDYVFTLGDWWKECKPYLRSMPSMTEKEHRTYISLLAHSLPHTTLDWLNKKHFDYRRNEDGEGLIEKGLALEAPKDMYK